MKVCLTPTFIIEPDFNVHRAWVTPLVGVWIEILLPPLNNFINRSHAPRGRVDWNWKLWRYRRNYWRSRPSWACGLKYYQSFRLSQMHAVTPLVGVWIEMLMVFKGSAGKWGHAPRGRVDWNNNSVGHLTVKLGHAPRGRVDWNKNDEEEFQQIFCHAPRGRVDWNSG